MEVGGDRGNMVGGDRDSTSMEVGGDRGNMVGNSDMNDYSIWQLAMAAVKEGNLNLLRHVSEGCSTVPNYDLSFDHNSMDNSNTLTDHESLVDTVKISFSPSTRLVPPHLPPPPPPASHPVVLNKSILSQLDAQGNSLLTWAAGGGYLDICKYLVHTCAMDSAVLTGHRRKQQRAPIHWAARNGHKSIIQWLVEEQRVDINIGTDNGTTPLHFCIWQGHIECIKYCIETAGCNINQLNIYGCSASHWAGYNGQVEIMQYLFYHGLDYNVLNDNRRSALHKAAVKGHCEACVWLIQSLEDGGCGYTSVHMKPEKEGDYPYALAASAGHHDLAAYLYSIHIQYKVDAEE